MIVVACPDRAERILQAGNMGCPRCPGRLRPFGHGRTRTVRGRGTATLRVTPRRARCGDCGGTQILLPANELGVEMTLTEAMFPRVRNRIRTSDQANPPGRQPPSPE